MSTNTTVVTDGELGQLSKKQFELYRRVKEGTLPLVPVLDALQLVIEGKEPVIPTVITAKTDASLIDLDAAPFTPNGWAVEEHRKGGQFKWDPTKVKFHLSKNQQNGKSIEGHKLRKELAKEPVFNANLLDFLMKPENQHLIPEDWKKDEKGNTRYIYFWGTVYRDSDGRLHVRFLYFRDGGWQWGYYWLDCVWDGYEPAAVFAS